jgi:hypothetical protein
MSSCSAASKKTSQSTPMTKQIWKRKRTISHGLEDSLQRQPIVNTCRSSPISSQSTKEYLDDCTMESPSNKETTWHMSQKWTPNQALRNRKNQSFLKMCACVSDEPTKTNIKFVYCIRMSSCKSLEDQRYEHLDLSNRILKTIVRYVIWSRPRSKPTQKLTQ